mmetsp:Transcript_57922/g.147053  ORF Transcript_57922/g.147053 Transcript_57922/m.147053 type:complete len:241 (+) Transcript_57922:64-786(+)
MSSSLDAKVLLAKLIPRLAAAWTLNAIARRRLSTEDLDGSPRWMWTIGLAFQSIIVPAMSWLAIVHTPMSLSAWLLAPRAGLSPTDIEVALALATYFLKDLVEPQKPLYHLHHVACASMTLGALFAPAAGPSVLFGGALLEVGTACMSASRHWPSVTLWRYAFFVGMSASNFACVVLFVHMLRGGVCPATVATAYAVVLVVLLALRQEVCHREFLAWWRMPRTRAVEKMKVRSVQCRVSD